MHAHSHRTATPRPPLPSLPKHTRLCTRQQQQCLSGHPQRAPAHHRAWPLQDLTLAQLQSLHLGGQEGCRAPSLQQFMEACAALAVAAPLVVEVKALHSDVGRGELLRLLRWGGGVHVLI